MLSFFDMKGLLGTTDKRIVTAAGLLFTTAFLLVNYTTFRSAIRGCAEDVPIPGVLPGGSTPRGESSVQSSAAIICPGGRPSGADLALSYGSTMPTVLVNGIALGLLCFFLWGAVRPGLHSPVTPGRLLTLGWFVLIAGPVATALENVFSYELAQSLLRNTAEYRDLAVPDSAWLQELQMHFPWWYVFAGVASLIVAKLLRIEVRMAEDLEGTI
jgi:hypothetical protein